MKSQENSLLITIGRCPVIGGGGGGGGGAFCSDRAHILGAVKV